MSKNLRTTSYEGWYLVKFRRFQLLFWKYFKEKRTFCFTEKFIQLDPCPGRTWEFKLCILGHMLQITYVYETFASQDEALKIDIAESNAKLLADIQAKGYPINSVAQAHWVTRATIGGTLTKESFWEMMRQTEGGGHA
jgi:hypothetical protein